MVLSNLFQPLPVLADFTSTSRQLLHDSARPYLKPTLTGGSCPVSAPSFERYVESQDVRYTADGYPERRLADARQSNTSHHKSASTTPSHSATLVPKHASNVRLDGGDSTEKLQQYIDGRRGTDNVVMGAMDKDDVQL
ncbi:hypothetical protein GWI33_009689 [Rhynchophorus ferrugineus]|uniref:Uncharacterized protein n=1 Tax=Rhynchophorus ferrugineus TaxID=354439 RepID=A0A834IMT1_RHYFE|nr:hypothetical protein GWI33_009689 [Rhynchophorus ferrugineus]